MKYKKSRIIFSLIASSALACGLTSFALSSCSSEINYDKLAKELKEEQIKEFFEICKHPRPTHHLDDIRCYLTNRAEAMGYEVKRDNYGNIWFSVPATPGKENLKKVILQGHMDMVVAGMTEDEATYTPITPVIEGNKMYAKDHKTSLGADNGHGLALILALLKNKNVPHGPLTIICTADEESGMNGAAHLNPLALDSNYLLNLDYEESNKIIKSSAGSVQGVYEKQFNFDRHLEKGIKDFKITVSGLHGGHSGIDIVKKLANADRLIGELWYEFTKSDIESEIEKQPTIVDFSHYDSEHKTIDWGPTQLITSAEAEFSNPGNVSIQNLNNILNNKLAEWKVRYSGENWENVDVKIIEQSAGVPDIISANANKCLASLIGSPFTTKETAQGLYYGVEFDPQHPEDKPLFSANIGPISFKGQLFKMKNYSRSAYNENVDWFKKNNEVQWTERFGLLGFSTPTCYYGWPGVEENKMLDLVKEAGDKFNNKLEVIDCLGGQELSWFVVKHPHMQQTALGPDLKDVHSVNETLYLDTLETMIKEVLYVLQNINKI